MFHLLKQSLYSMKSFSVGDLFLRTLRWITSPSILEAESNSSLERLDSTHHPVKSHRLSTYPILLQICNHFQQFWNLAHINRLLQPFSPLNGRASQDGWKAVSMIFDIKPSWFLVDHFFETTYRGCKPYSSSVAIESLPHQLHLIQPNLAEA